MTDRENTERAELRRGWDDYANSVRSYMWDLSCDISLLTDAVRQLSTQALRGNTEEAKDAAASLQWWFG